MFIKAFCRESVTLHRWQLSTPHTAEEARICYILLETLRLACASAFGKSTQDAPGIRNADRAFPKQNAANLSQLP
jgi:hypothetical protein